jgi:hypothetical protein
MKNQTEIIELPEVAKSAIESYQKLELGGNQVECPYYMNIKRHKDLRSMVGKGTAEEIVMESKIWEKLKGISFDKMSEAEIRQFLIERGLGIDCSAFVVHVLDAWFRSVKKKHIWSCLKIHSPSFLHKIAYKLKPVEKLGADVLTSEINCERIELNDVKPGDLVRSKWKRRNAHHVLIVSKVEKENGVLKRIEYVESTPFYGDKNGVLFGEIEITDSSKPLQDQNWLTKDENGVNFTYEGFLEQVEDNGLRRLRCMKNIY